LYSLKDKIDFIQSVFGQCIVSSDGINVAVQCPSCGPNNNAKKKLSIRLDTDYCHCWVCGLKSRSLAPVIRKFYSRSSLEEYYKKFKPGKLSSFDGDIDDQEEVIDIKLPKGFRLLGSEYNSIDPDLKSVLRYLRRRGIKKRDLWYYRLGTCTSGRFRRRIIIPSFDLDGKLNYYVGRAIDSDIVQRYINARVPKIEIIFNEINLRWDQELTLVEGPFDLMKCNDNATCLLGSGLSSESRLFNRIIVNRTPVLLGLDPDMKDKTQKIAKMLFEFNVPVRILDVGQRDDVGEMTRPEFENARKEAKEWSSDDMIFHMIDSISSSSMKL
jgi:hypothetical protein